MWGPAVRFGMIVFTGLLASGCAGLPGFSSAAPDRDVRITSAGELRACRFVANVSAMSSYPEDDDMQQAALQRLQADASEKGADTLVVGSISIADSNRVVRASVTTMAGKAYVCQGEPKEVN